VRDADIAKGFERIDRKALLRKTGTFPTLQRLIKRWLNDKKVCFRKSCIKMTLFDIWIRHSKSWQEMRLSRFDL